LSSKDSYMPPTREMNAADVLPLRKIYADHTEVERILHNKTVLINGPSGALGLELCRKILQGGCRKLIIIDRYESYLNELMGALLNRFPQNLIAPFLIDAGREEQLEEVFRVYQPSLVIHAGMRKYEPFLGVDLGDLSRINYSRTFHLAQIAAKFECELFILLSSLLAAKGGNILMDSLRVAEVSLGYFFSETQTRLIIVRLCDIAENRGGIVSLIEDRIRKREPVILPNASAPACLISVHSAVEFILHALVEGKREIFAGQVFSIDPGPPIPLIQLTERIANLYRLRLGSDVEVKYVGTGGAAYTPTRLSPLSGAIYIVSVDGGGANENLGMTKERIKSTFRDFVLFDDNKWALLDWKTKTRELLNMCGSDFSMTCPQGFFARAKEKGISSLQT